MESRATIRIGIALALAAVGCGAAAKGLDKGIERNRVEAPQASQHDQLVTAGDAAWDQRADRAQLELAIQKWEQAVAIVDSDADTYAKLSRACYLLADGWLFFDQKASPGGEAAFLAMHEKGYRLAERGLAALSPQFEKRRMAGTKIEDAIKVIGRNGAPLMYWYASNLGKWAKAKGFTTTLEHKDRIFAVISRVLEVAPDYFYGAADRYFGAFYSVAPKFAGGDVQKSYEHFQVSLKAAPNYLGTYVLIAELYTPLEDAAAGKKPDPAAFDANLDIVLNAKPCPEGGAQSPVPCILPDLAPEAAIEQKKARELEARKDELF